MTDEPKDEHGDIRTETYALPKVLQEGLVSLAFTIEEDIVKKTGMPRELAHQMVAKILNVFAYNLHAQDAETEKGNGGLIYNG